MKSTYEHLMKDFIAGYGERGMTLDSFQYEAIEALAHGRDVLVCAPTGSGKTLVAHFGVELALARMMRCVYTAPIKALSNQKYRELSAMLGEENVGLLTGDVSVNRDASVLVVTTEVLRNMLFHRDATMDDIGYVVLDEVHFLGDESRGPVWEEIILQLPPHIRLVSLSATIANAEEFAAWLASVRGSTALITSTIRPVPLTQYALAHKEIVPLTDGHGGLSSKVRKELTAFERRADAYRAYSRSARSATPRMRRTVLSKLRENGMLPAIHFIFSRKGCDRAVEDLLDAGLVLTTPAERRFIHDSCASLRDQLSDADARTVKFNFWRKAMMNGYGAHHAGIFLPLKQLVEELTSEGYLKLVYATGTLALGIDMPVRTVVLDELSRWNGSDFVPLSGTEYTQLVGRAGRRGKDVQGNVVVVLSQGIDASHLEALSDGEVEPLNSVFFPSYNAVVNLLTYYTVGEAKALMGQSFAQYQRNADLATLSARLARVERKIAEEESRLSGTCSQGDFVEYVRIRQTAGRATKAERKRAKAEYRAQIQFSWENAQIGHAYAYGRDGDLEYGVVIQAGEKKLRLISLDAELVWLRRMELSSQLRDLGTIEMPFGISPKDPRVRDTIASRLLDRVAQRVDLGTDRDLMKSWDRSVVRETPELTAHPVHSCPHLRQHLKEASELIALDASAAELKAVQETYTDAVAHEFERTAEVLQDLGYIQRGIDGERMRLGAGGAMLREIHNEYDLLITLVLREKAIEHLSAAEFAGLCSAFLGDRRIKSGLPHTPELRAAWDAVWHNYLYVHSREMRTGIERTPEPVGGGIEDFSRWASGDSLDSVLRGTGMAVGDFITANRRLVDLLGQIAVAGEGTKLGELAIDAKRLVDRWQWL
ncbi:MAG: DEAD/DEAH box helicase [Actinomycetaceae bacterium]|nr:DEAD/DEAH box helicase [Arcanobacterium sp.]MDD7505751.1 DEAD/DEAH box helicase [Actinomycetaceae bacterium]MDY6143650.1 DEAD/DEAH box helicase [Arcanobacterium sp.]